MHPLLVIAGPTGSGKSALALHLAATFSGEIVNCDSMQLYKGFDIGTAKTPVGERCGIPHHLFDVLETQTVSTAGDYARLARPVLREIAERGRLPIVTGGTGFYLRALLDGLPPLPPRDEAVRARLAAREVLRPGSLHRLLTRLEPEAAARIHATDTQKLTRALEVRMLTRTSLPALGSGDAIEGFRVLQLALSPDRDALKRSIAGRTRRMFQNGLVEEVRALAARTSQRDKPFESLGYKQALAHLRGEMTLDAAIESTEIETRQYAKRQWTWFRRDPRIVWLDGFGIDPAVQASAERITQERLLS